MRKTPTILVLAVALTIALAASSLWAQPRGRGPRPDDEVKPGPPGRGPQGHGPHGPTVQEMMARRKAEMAQGGPPKAGPHRGRPGARSAVGPRGPISAPP